MGGPSYLARVQAGNLRRYAARSVLKISFAGSQTHSLYAPNRLSVVLSMKEEMERETGLEPATFSLEGLSVYAQ